MAIIKKNELKAMEKNALGEKLREIENAIQEEFATLNTSRRSKTVKYRSLRRTRARIKTLLYQRGVK